MSPLRLTLEERTVVPVTACCEEELRAWLEDDTLPLGSAVFTDWLLEERAVEPLTAELLPEEVLC